ncbi:S-adenosyl-L-methionine-dependent methyltransferase [Ochromonadaceae sp. CCMP2298]|nr:S-adenosyl-L-methionine-dependent methyltransferase [Ochromonadaceae sp. CCMP2298]
MSFNLILLLCVCLFHRRVLDVGCSVGVSTTYLAQAFPQAPSVVGLDLSPHFLVRTWKHANIEHAPYADCAFDLVCSSFMFHELPQTAARAVLREMVRLVAPGGWVAITDINPQSPVIQGLPPALFTLMKSTEPWSDQYYALDMGAALAEAGFEAVEAVPTDPRHHAVFGRKKA